jgi:hypothetical protein
MVHFGLFLIILVYFLLISEISKRNLFFAPELPKIQLPQSILTLLVLGHKMMLDKVHFFEFRNVLDHDIILYAPIIYQGHENVVSIN